MMLEYGNSSSIIAKFTFYFRIATEMEKSEAKDTSENTRKELAVKVSVNDRT